MCGPSHGRRSPRPDDEGSDNLVGKLKAREQVRVPDDGSGHAEGGNHNGVLGARRNLQTKLPGDVTDRLRPMVKDTHLEFDGEF